MTPRVRVGRLLGVDVDVAFSGFVTFVLAAWTLVSVAERALPRAGYPVRTIVATVATAGLFASLALHEVAHGVASRALGVPVRRITMFMLGGITDVERAPSSPKTEAIAASVAPLANALLGAFFFVLALAFGRGALPSSLSDVARLGVAGAVVAWLSVANLAIAAFNLVPAYPLDGGRVLRALLWRLTGDVERATRWAAWSGQVFGWSALVAGIGLAFVGRGLGVGLAMWLAFMGWFLASAAAQAYEGVIVQDVLAGVTVSRLMRRQVSAVPADVSVATAVHGWLARGRESAAAVVDRDRFVGVITMGAVDRLAPSEWRDTSARDLADRDRALFVGPADRALDALRKFADLGVTRLPVVEGLRLVGVLEHDDVTRWIEARLAGAGRGAETSHGPEIEARS
jgi:Zn-dependent protease